jgi:hypothetical protein
VRVWSFLRFTAVVLTITALYAGLERAWVSLAPIALSFFDESSRAAWQRERVSVATASGPADGRLGAEWRLSAYLLGFELGYCSNMLGSVAFAAPSKRVEVSEALAPSFTAAQDLARELGVGPAAVLPVATVDDFFRMKDRMEADELGVASRIEAASSRRHRHLFMLGLHVGAAAAVAESTSGEVHNPARDHIGRHATVAGVPAEAWEPVARVPQGADPAARLAAYRAALAALERAVAQLEPMPVDRPTS